MSACGDVSQRLLPDREEVFQIPAQIFEDATESRKFDTIVNIIAGVLDGFVQQGITCCDRVTQFVGQFLCRNSRRFIFTGSGSVRSQHAKDLQFVPVGIDVELGDEPRQRQFILGNVCELIAIEFLRER